MDKQKMYIQAIEYYLAIKKKIVLIPITTWINFENILLMKEDSH